MKQVHVINVYESGDSLVGPASPAKTIYVESEMSREEMQRFALGRGLSSLADNANTISCSTLDVMSLDEFEAAHPRPVPSKRRLGNKKRRPNLRASLAKKRAERASTA